MVFVPIVLPRPDPPHPMRRSTDSRVHVPTFITLEYEVADTEPGHETAGKLYRQWPDDMLKGNDFNLVELAFFHGGHVWGAVRKRFDPGGDWETIADNPNLGMYGRSLLKLRVEEEIRNVKRSHNFQMPEPPTKAQLATSMAKNNPPKQNSVQRKESVLKSVIVEPALKFFETIGRLTSKN